MAATGGPMAPVDVPVLDFHAHFPVRGSVPQAGEAHADYLRRFGAERWRLVERHLQADQSAWRRAWGFPDPEPLVDDDETMAARWVEEVRRHHLLRVVFLTGGGNDRLAAAIRRYGEAFVGFAHHDPFAPGAPAELERAVSTLGLRGYKIIAPFLREPLNDARLFPLWEVAERLRIPVLVHFGPLRYEGIVAGPNISPLVLQDVARGFPAVPFIVPHFGCGYPRELLHLMWVCGNVYVDTSGSNEWMRWMPYPLDLRTLFQRFVDTVGPARIIFGTDSSWFPRGFARRYLEVQWEACAALGLSVDDLRLIFAGNAARLLDLSTPVPEPPLAGPAPGTPQR